MLFNDLPVIIQIYILLSPYKFKVNPLSTNPTKWSNTLKQFVGNLPTKCRLQIYTRNCCRKLIQNFSLYFIKFSICQDKKPRKHGDINRFFIVVIIVIIIMKHIFAGSYIDITMDNHGHGYVNIWSRFNFSRFLFLRRFWFKRLSDITVILFACFLGFWKFCLIAKTCLKLTIKTSGLLFLSLFQYHFR